MGTSLSFIFPHSQESAPLLPFNPLSPQVRVRKKEITKNNRSLVSLLLHPFGTRTVSVLMGRTWIFFPLCSSFCPRRQVGGAGTQGGASMCLPLPERGQNLAEHKATWGDSGRSVWVTTAGGPSSNVFV